MHDPRESNPETTDPVLGTEPNSASIPKAISVATGSGASTLAVPERGSRRYLVGFMDRTHLAPQIASVVAAMTPAEQTDLWARHDAAQQAAKSLPVENLAIPELVAFANAEVTWAAEVEKSELFQRSFGAQKYQFAHVPIARLTCFQPFLKSLHTAISNDNESILQACLPREFSIRPETQVVQNPNGFRFLFYSDDPAPEFAVEAIKPGTIQLALKARPNWVQVAICNGRLVLRNGYHRVAALAARGQTTIPAIVVTMPNPAEIVPPSPDFFAAHYFFGLARPPMVADYFNPSIAFDFDLPEVRRIVEARLDLFDFALPR